MTPPSERRRRATAEAPLCPDLPCFERADRRAGYSAPQGDSSSAARSRFSRTRPPANLDELMAAAPRHGVHPMAFIRESMFGRSIGPRTVRSVILARSVYGMCTPVLVYVQNTNTYRLKTIAKSPTKRFKTMEDLRRRYRSLGKSDAPRTKRTKTGRAPSLVDRVSDSGNATGACTRFAFVVRGMPSGRAARLK